MLRVGLELGQPRLHDVADADDAGEHPVGRDRYVPDAQFGHDRHHLDDRVARAARGAADLHEVGDLVPQDAVAALRETPHDVALRDDALDGQPVAGDDERADAPETELVDDVGDGRLGVDRGDRRPLGGQDGGHPHGNPLMLGHGPLPRSLRPCRRSAALSNGITTSHRSASAIGAADGGRDREDSCPWASSPTST